MEPVNFISPTVVIFGAGATRGAFEAKAVPPPVDGDFFDIVKRINGRRTEVLADKVLKDVALIYGKTHGISLEEYYRDIESRIVIGGTAKTSGKKKDWETRRDNLVELIRRTLIHTTCTFDNETFKFEKSIIHEKILNKLKSNDSIITFNYDLLIESSFGMNPNWNPIHGYGFKAETPTPSSKSWAKKWLHDYSGKVSKSSIRIFKLHGSINWKTNKHYNLKLKSQPNSVMTKGTTIRKDEVAILAPGNDKPIDEKPFNAIWQKARLKLDKCKTLVIIGYSLPDADNLAQALFKEVVRVRGEKIALRKLFLVDPSKTVLQKFNNLFNPILKPNSDVLEFKNMSEFVEKLDSANG